MSITIRNNYPVDPFSPAVVITVGEGKKASTFEIAPQQSAPLGEGEIKVALKFPKKPGEETEENAPAEEEKPAA